MLVPVLYIETECLYQDTEHYEQVMQLRFFFLSKQDCDSTTGLLIGF